MRDASIRVPNLQFAHRLGNGLERFLQLRSSWSIIAHTAMIRSDVSAMHLQRPLIECGSSAHGLFSCRPFFAKAAGLDVPIYIHPSLAADEWMPHHRGNFGEGAAQMMSTAGWG